ncbi:porphobilinogen synthase [Streptomyces olivoreticuli]|uniref:porphobilinogen synthase n=1 Tax=Streptomyces olivoreticuli TaxID=68246 RepID=UPI000E2368DE|nr:porphobilinogen synthase [Streptomyces olivoreticuli]
MPVHRPAVRHFLAGPSLTPADLSMVLLVREDDGQPDCPLPTVTVREIPKTVREMASLGIRSVKIFAGSRMRDDRASQATSPHSLMVRSIKAVKGEEPEVAVMTETCVCSHTNSGECYLADGHRVDVAATGEALAAQAVTQAEAGADIVGPASMIPGTIRAVRAALDESGHLDVSIMPHLIFDSSLYEGYRATMGAAPASETRAFQIAPRQADQAVRAGLDMVAEGADLLLLEPALFTVDTMIRLREAGCPAPLMPFSVSGEYNRLAPAGEDGTRDVRPLMEALTMLKRSGADRVITYGAVEIARVI